MRIVDPVTDQQLSKVVTPDGTWVLDPVTGLVNFTPSEGFYGRAEVEFVVTTRKGVTYRSLLSVYVARLNPTIPVTGTESSTPLVWGMWLVVAGVLAGALGRRRQRLF
jgi:MYXO-CTERM domain-containing protein